MEKITQAFVLGAGLGTRLRPLTDDLPKPLIPIFQKPLITFAFDHLIDAGLTKFVVNTHHRPERFAELFGGKMAPSSRLNDSNLSLPYRDHRIVFRNEQVLLETAGGIANIADLLGKEPLLVYNADILTDLPLNRLIEEHLRAGNLVTLALRSSTGPKHIAFDFGTGRVIDIRNYLGTGAPEQFVFAGVYLIEAEFVDLLQRGVKRSVIPVFLDLIRREERVGGVVIDDGAWWDVGNRDAYLQLHRELLDLNFPRYRVDHLEWKKPIHETAAVDPTAELRGCTVVGPNCRVGAGAILEDTILWSGAQIASRSKLSRCIVRSRQKAHGVHLDADI